MIRTKNKQRLEMASNSDFLPGRTLNETGMVYLFLMHNEKQSIFDLLDEVNDHRDPDQDPLKVTQTGSLVHHGLDYNDKVAHGKWLFIKNFEDLRDTWQVIKEELKSRRLGVIGAKCSTLMYNPLCYGSGPKTTGRISVFTKKEDQIEIGMNLINLPVVHHDIIYITMEATFNHHTTDPLECITDSTLFWNDGNPSLDQHGPRCPPHCRNDASDYDPSQDKWKLHIVNGHQRYASEHIHGKWIVVSDYAKLNITKLWHTLKPKVEEGEVPAIRMECPAPRQLREIHVFASESSMTTVGKKIIQLLKNDITYIVGGSTFSNDRKVLYWNNGTPSYYQGSQESWR